MDDNQAPIVIVPRSQAEGSVGRQIQQEWAILRKRVSVPSHATQLREAIRKLDALIGYHDGD